MRCAVTLDLRDACRLPRTRMLFLSAHVTVTGCIVSRSGREHGTSGEDAHSLREGSQRLCSGRQTAIPVGCDAKNSSTPPRYPLACIDSCNATQSAPRSMGTGASGKRSPTTPMGGTLHLQHVDVWWVGWMFTNTLFLATHRRRGMQPLSSSGAPTSFSIDFSDKLRTPHHHRAILSSQLLLTQC